MPAYHHCVGPAPADRCRKVRRSLRLGGLWL